MLVSRVEGGTGVGGSVWGVGGGGGGGAKCPNV